MGEGALVAVWSRFSLFYSVAYWQEMCPEPFRRDELSQNVHRRGRGFGLREMALIVGFFFIISQVVFCVMVWDLWS